jgi:hypothetical protein
MLRSGLIALFSLCPLWVYLRGNMEPAQLHSASAVEHTASRVGWNRCSPDRPPIERTNLHLEQDTTKATAAKQPGEDAHNNSHSDSVLLRLSRMDEWDQVATMKDCATQLRRLQERVDFLERYVYELLPPPSPELLDRHQQRPFTQEYLNFLKELMQGAMLPTTPEEK